MLSITFAALACHALAGPSPLQVDYSQNWQSLNYGFQGSLIFAGGSSLWGPLVGPSGSVSGSIRICYGIDAMQGGSHADGITDVTWMQLVQGHGAGTQQNQAAVVSVTTTTFDSAAGDACFAPALGQVNPQTGLPLDRLSSEVFLFSDLTWGLATPVPTFSFSYFQLFDGQGGGLPAKNRLGTDPGGLFPGENPLLAHLVLEVQGPSNTGVQNIQYYLATTDEVVGPNGGVTNGNLSMGEGLFGLGYTADLTGATAHSRLAAFSAATGTLVGTTTAGFGGLGTDQWLGALATATPAVWSGNDPNGSGSLNTGGGGVDWAISNAVSTIQLRALDRLSGAEVAGTAIDPAAGPPSSITNAALVASQAYFVFSNSEAVGTFQTPCGWCDYRGVQPMDPGDSRVGAFDTHREGPQLLPVCFDNLSATFSNQASYCVGTTFRGAYDAFADGGQPGTDPSGQPWPFATLFDNGVGLDLAGSSQMPAPLPIAPASNPFLAAEKMCVTAALLQTTVDSQTGALHLSLNEFANVATVMLH
jgi:hypothetical protein